MLEPTEKPLTISLTQLPHGFLDASEEDLCWFAATLNSDIRYYYRMIRSQHQIPEHNPVGTSGITAGEMALYLIRQNHTKRQRRY